MLSSIGYTSVVVLALLNAILCVGVVHRAQFCAPVNLLFIGIVAIYNAGLLMSGTQRLVQHDSATVGMTVIILGQLATVPLLGWVLYDSRPRR